MCEADRSGLGSMRCCSRLQCFFYWNLVQELEAIVLTFIKSIRTHNWKMYVKSLKILCPWFFALNHHLYARWASVHIRDIET